MILIRLNYDLFPWTCGGCNSAWLHYAEDGIDKRPKLWLKRRLLFIFASVDSPVWPFGIAVFWNGGSRRFLWLICSWSNGTKEKSTCHKLSNIDIANSVTAPERRMNKSTVYVPVIRHKNNAFSAKGYENVLRWLTHDAAQSDTASSYWPTGWDVTVVVKEISIRCLTPGVIYNQWTNDLKSLLEKLLEPTELAGTHATNWRMFVD